MNIAIVGLNYAKVKTIAQAIANCLHLMYVDVNGELEQYLLEFLDFPIFVADDFLQNKESELIDNFIKTDNMVVAIKDDSFLSNENYKKFNTILTILIESKQNNKINENIQKLLKKYTKIHIKEENLDINSIIDIIRG